MKHWFIVSPWQFTHRWQQGQGAIPASRSSAGPVRCSLGHEISSWGSSDLRKENVPLLQTYKRSHPEKEGHPYCSHWLEASGRRVWPIQHWCRFSPCEGSRRFSPCVCPPQFCEFEEGKNWRGDESSRPPSSEGILKITSACVNVEVRENVFVPFLFYFFLWLHRCLSLKLDSAGAASQASFRSTAKNLLFFFAKLDQSFVSNQKKCLILQDKSELHSLSVVLMWRYTQPVNNVARSEQSQNPQTLVSNSVASPH